MKLRFGYERGAGHPCRGALRRGHFVDESEAMFDESHFLGLGLDDENQSEMHDERIHAWLMKVMTDCKLLPV